MADFPCMKNRSLKAGGRLNRWSLKAGFTVQASETAKYCDTQTLQVHYHKQEESR